MPNSQGANVVTLQLQAAQSGVSPMSELDCKWKFKSNKEGSLEFKILDGAFSSGKESDKMVLRSVEDDFETIVAE